MASSMLGGDRRWAPTRKGMTILGKVPKPINLPSQRLENHGLDPNVEIVPKGTLTWGSRPSPPTTNAWGLSNQSSANADGSVDSPSRFSGRPSSSGSGTRPSTAGSDWSSERVASAWKSNSRPSSASGLLVSNQTQPAARPQSAETRPGSSQLSRFADSSTGHSGPWGSAGTAQKMGPASPGARDFSLSSGDFPAFGSAKTSEPHYEQENYISSIDRPSPAAIEDKLEISQSGTEKMDVHSDAGNTNSWKMEMPSKSSDTSAGTDSWHGNIPNVHLATNINSARSLSNPWHVHSRNPSVGVWYRGPPGGSSRPPSTVPCGSYQQDPCTYYPSQIPVRLDPNSHCAPRGGGHPTAYQNDNGDGFRPPPPETFIVSTTPIIPVRPGLYRGPVPYDGQFVSSVGFGSPNIRESSVMGFAPGPLVYGQFPNQNFHHAPGPVPLRPSGNIQLPDEKIENTRQLEFASGQYKVLLKHHNHPDGTDSEGHRAQFTTSKALSLEKNGNAEAVSGLRPRQKVIKDDPRKSTGGEILLSSDLRISSQETIPTNSFKLPSARAFDKELKKDDFLAASTELKHLATKNTKLIEKIETLNNKTRVFDGYLEGPILNKSDKNKRVEDGNPAHYGFQNSVPSGSPSSVSSGIEPPILKSTPGESATPLITSTSEYQSTKNLPIASQTHASTFIVSGSFDGNANAHYRRTQNIQGKGDHVSKSRLDCEEKINWPKQLPRKDSCVNPNNNSIPDELLPEEAVGSQDRCSRPGPPHMDKPRDEAYMPSSFDSVDYKTQRAKMKEIAMQRAKQLQQEEEERNREQKAKALAKLEELNRRCNSSSSSELRIENNTCGSALPGAVLKTSTDPPNKYDGPIPPLTSGSDSSQSERATKNDMNTCNLEKPSLQLGGQLPDMNSGKENVSDTGKNKVSNTQYIDPTKDCQYFGSLAASVDPFLACENVPADSLKKNNSHHRDHSSSKKAKVGHRRKQSIPDERNLEGEAVVLVEHASSETSMEVAAETAVNESVQSNEPCNLSAQQRRHERSSKNKNKSEDAIECTDLSSSSQAKGILEKPADIHQHKHKLPQDESSLLIAKTEKAITNQNFREMTGSCAQGLLQATGGSAKATSHWKSNHSKRPSRNGQSRPLDKLQGNDTVVWSPVRPSKGELNEENQGIQVHANVTGDSSSTSGVSNSLVNMKSKRAEMQRYVPKVIKNTPQEGNMQIPDQQTPAETTITDTVVVGNTKGDGSTKSDSATIRRNAELKTTNKHGKSYGASASWRQRSFQDGSLDAASTGMNVSGQKQSEDASSHSHTNRSSDIPVTPNDMSNEPMGISVLKEPGNTNKSRPQIQKVPKVVLADAKDSTRENVGKVEGQSLASEWNATSTKGLTAETLNPVERAKSQWKPKSQPVSSHSNHQDIGSGGEKCASQSILPDKETSSVKGQHSRAPDKNIAGKGAAFDERHHQPRKERKDLPLENHLNDRAGHNGESYQGNPSLSPERRQHGTPHMKGKDIRNVARFYKGQNNIYGDGSRQNMPINGDRQRQTSHYEYQRIEARDFSDQFQSADSTTREIPGGSTPSGLKFREKAQGHKKGSGRFYVRSTGSFQDDKNSGRQS